MTTKTTKTTKTTHIVCGECATALEGGDLPADASAERKLAIFNGTSAAQRVLGAVRIGDIVGFGGKCACCCEHAQGVAYQLVI